MKNSQRRAWRALGLGPAWVARGGADPAEPLAACAPAGTCGAAAADAYVDARGKTLVGAAEAAHAAPGPESGHASRVARMGWPELRSAVASCQLCALAGGRTQTVFGVGDERARWLLVGEAPGAEEDARGEPFVGQAGRLLDSMLAALGLTREKDVFIANVLKCRPPRNRDPEPHEVRQCEPYLRRQVELLDPAIIVVMGRFAAQTLLQTDASIASLRGRVHRYRAGTREVPVVVTYHPAYLLRTPADKARSWVDLCLAREEFARAPAARS